MRGKKSITDLSVFKQINTILDVVVFRPMLEFRKKVIYDINNYEILLNNNFIHNDLIQNNNVKFFYKNNEIKGTFNSIENKITSNYTNIIDEYKKEPFYVEEKYNNNIHKFKTDSYNLLGYIRKDSSGLSLSNTYSDEYYLTDYLLVNNKLINKKKLSSYTLNDSVIGDCYSIILDSFHSINKFQKNSFNIYFIKLELDGELVLNENNFYYSNINGINVLLFYQNNYLNIFSKLRISYKNKIKLIYRQVSGNIIDLISELDNYIFIPYQSFFILEDFKIVEFKILNWYIKLSDLENNNYYFSNDNVVEENTIIFNENDSYIIRYENTILDKLIRFHNFDNKILFIDLDLNTDQIFNKFELNKVSKILEPPIIINNNSISLLNILNEFDFIKYQNHWIKIKNIEFQIKDKYIINDEVDDINNNKYLEDGNYLLYYCHSSIKPQEIPYTDLYYFKIKTLPSIKYDPYKKIYVLDKSLSQLKELFNNSESDLVNKLYKFYVYGTPRNTENTNFYYPLSLENYDNSILINFIEFPNTNFYYDSNNAILNKEYLEKKYKYLISYNLYGNNINLDDFTHKPINNISINTKDNLDNIISFNSSKQFDKNMITTYEFTGENVPQIDFKLLLDNISGYNIRFTLINFKLTLPTSIIEEFTGFIKLYVNGVKQYEFYNILNNISLPFGNNEIIAELVLHNDKTLTRNNIKIRKIKNINITTVNTLGSYINFNEVTTNDKPSFTMKHINVNNKDILNIDLNNFYFTLPTGNNVNDNEGYGRLIVNTNVFRLLNTSYSLKLNNGINNIRLELVNHDDEILTINNVSISKQLKIIKNGELVLNTNANIYTDTNIILTNNNNIINRPIIITDRPSIYRLSYFDTNYLFESDSFNILDKKNINNNEIFVKNIRFNHSVHNSDLINIESSNNNLVITQIDSLNWKIKLVNTNYYKETVDLNNIRIYKFIYNVYKFNNNIISNKEEKILWIVISSILPQINFVETDNLKTNMLIEPLHLSVDKNTVLTLEDNIDIDILSVDEMYFNLVITKVLIIWMDYQN